MYVGNPVLAANVNMTPILTRLTERSEVLVKQIAMLMKGRLITKIRMLVAADGAELIAAPFKDTTGL